MGNACSLLLNFVCYFNFDCVFGCFQKAFYDGMRETLERDS